MGLRIKFSIRAVLLLITVVAILLALQLRAIHWHNEAAERLLQQGGQFDFTPIQVTHWLSGTRPKIDELKFFGPTVSDAAIDDIVDVATTFHADRISLIETLVSAEGELRLRSDLPDVQIRVITMGMDMPMTTPLR